MPEEQDSNAQSGLDGLSVTDLIGIIRGLRSENAAKRVASKEKDAELEEFRTWKANQETEVDRIKREHAETAEALRMSWIDGVVKEFSVPEARKGFLTGKTVDELREQAKSLGEESTDNSSNDTNDNTNSSTDWAKLFPGRRGAPVNGGSDPNALLRARLRA